MRKLTTLLIVIIIGVLTTSCSQSQNSPTPSNANGTFKYEVISNVNWQGSYYSANGDVVSVQNKPSGWVYSGTPYKLPFPANITVRQWSSNGPIGKFVINIYRNDVLIATSDTSIGQTQLNYFIRN